MIGRDNVARCDEGFDRNGTRKKVDGSNERSDRKRKKGDDNDTSDTNGLNSERRGDGEKNPEKEMTIIDDGGIGAHDDHSREECNQPVIKQVD